ncbi:hypothetical protein [Polaribacter sp. Hel_I_88]|uniref:hypothetical protein n=1 Tax=Polaribacter sp. Hel_I_88 TaxID=1250006 RepID=UPI0004788837|nr:hypothetical protein [Polaribacter sp. Hel_I_88]
MRFAIIKDSERELLNEVAEANKDENSLWKIPNLLIPIGAIILAFLCLISFSEKRTEILVYFNLILNGSLPLIAINQISGIGLHVFKFDRNKEKNLNINDTIVLRTKLWYYSLGILILGILLFAVQVINSPFLEFSTIIILLIISALLVYASSNISRKIFLLQEDFLDKTFDSVIRESSNEHGQSWGN